MSQNETLEDKYRKGLLKSLKKHGYTWARNDPMNPAPVGVRHLAQFLDGLDRLKERKKRAPKPKRKDRAEIVARQKKYRARYGAENGN